MGLTTKAIVKAFRDPGCFTDEGYCHPVAHGKYVLQDADVIRFVSRADDEHGAHSAIMLEARRGGCCQRAARAALRGSSALGQRGVTSGPAHVLCV